MPFTSSNPGRRYGFGYYVDGVVVAVHRTRVTIRVRRRNGVVVDRRVSQASLRAAVEP